MRKIDLPELKEIELNMLKYLDSVCKEKGIKYYIAYGTLLGAVRHQGFIPWDDDIDVAMSRKDFSRLQEEINSRNSIYKIEFYNTARDYGYSSPKMVDTRTTLIDYKLGNGKEESSVFIDIFLDDGMGNHFYSALARYWTLKIFKKAVFLSKRNFIMETKLKTAVFAIPWLICRLIGVNKLNRLYNWLASSRDYSSSEYVACVAGNRGRKDIFKRSVLENTVDLKFEDALLPAPSGYKEYLTCNYGDFMQLPPIESRVSNHMSEAWWNTAG